MSYVDYIYQLAKDENYAALKSFLESELASVDVFERRPLSPAGLLALHGYKEQALFMLRRFGANESYIAEGFAQANDYETAMQLYRNDGARMYEIVRGAARGNNQPFVWNQKNTCPAVIKHAAMGFAQAGNENCVRQLLNEVFHGPQKREIASWAAFGAAQAGCFPFARSLCDNYYARADFAVKGSARGGYIRQALAFQNRFAVSTLDLAIGMAQGGNGEQLASLVVNSDQAQRAQEIYAAIAKYSAYCGHIELMKSYAFQSDKQGMMEDVATYAANGGHKLFAINLVSQNYASIDSMVSGFRQGGHISNDKQLVKLISLVTDRTLQLSLMDSVRQQTSNVQTDFEQIDIKALIRQAKLLLEDFILLDRKTLTTVVDMLDRLENNGFEDQDKVQLVESVRGHLRPYWRSEQHTHVSSLNTDMESAAYQALKILARVAPLNDQDIITCDEIPRDQRVFSAAGHQYEVTQLANWMNQTSSNVDYFNIEMDPRDVDEVNNYQASHGHQTSSNNEYGFFSGFPEEPEPGRQNRP